MVVPWVSLEVPKELAQQKPDVFVRLQTITPPLPECKSILIQILNYILNHISIAYSSHTNVIFRAFGGSSLAIA